jgi:hypothetical protein
LKELNPPICVRNLYRVTEAHDGEQNRKKLARYGEGHQHYGREGAHDVKDKALPHSIS